MLPGLRADRRLPYGGAGGPRWPPWGRAADGRPAAPRREAAGSSWHPSCHPA